MFLSKRMWRQFIPLGIAVTLLCLLMYLSLQQMYRNNLNDPQIQVSQEVKEALDAGTAPKDLISPGSQINIEDSLSTFLIVYGKDKKPIAATGRLEDKVPVLSEDIFMRVDKNGEVRTTWEPKNKVHIASVIQKSNEYYILVGRSMKEIENRILVLGIQILIAWVATLILVYGSMLIVNQRKKPGQE